MSGIYKLFSTGGGRVELEGANELIAQLDFLQHQLGKNVEQLYWKIGLDLQGKAQRRAPVDTGALRGSAFTNLYRQAGSDAFTVDVGFSEKYALRQHEEIGWHHPSLARQGIMRSAWNAAQKKKKSGKTFAVRGYFGESKFLENPFKENIAKYINMVKHEIINTIEKAGGNKGKTT
jgi:hypothetical protein